MSYLRSCGFIAGKDRRVLRLGRLGKRESDSQTQRRQVTMSLIGTVTGGYEEMRTLGRLTRLLLSILFAYPLSGVAMGIVALIKDPSFFFHHPLALVVSTSWFVVFTPVYGGFPPIDEGFVNHKNMYPWIIPTAAILFVLLSKGWRWLRWKKP